MDIFSSDSNFYEIGTSDDLKALWDAELDTDPMLGSFRSSLYDADEWSLTEAVESKPQVVIHDRLMSDAAFATAPIKTEHSYSYPMPDSPCSLVGKLEDSDDDDDDDDDDNMDTDSFESTSLMTPEKCRNISDMIVIKEEPQSDTESVDSYCMSPESPSSSTTVTSVPKICRQQEQQSILKKSAVYLNTSNTLVTQGRPLILPKLEIKVESSTTGFSLPPTPPSSTSSDNEGGVSPDVDSRLRHYRKQSATRVYLSSGSRQPIQSPLISTQMKGITGTLTLTEEEKRTLVAEGYPIPTRLPLSKAEEKALKKIRRKIKNKISAQESRRKKKEYMDSLEKKVEVLTNENFDFKKKIELLEDSNAAMLRELKKLQAIVTKDLLGSSSRTINVPQHIAAKNDLSSRPSRS